MSDSIPVRNPEDLQWFRPVAPFERMEILDVLRGLAIFGILLYNIQVFSGYIFLETAQANAFRSSAADRTAVFIVRFLVQGKFYSLFSFLFGVSFAILTQRTEVHGVRFVPLYKRRLLILLGIGLCHALLIWAGDILIVYALLGFALLLFGRCTEKTLLWWSLGLFALPMVVYMAMLAVDMPDPFYAAETLSIGSGNRPSLQTQMVNGFATGTYPEALRANAILLAGRWLDLFLTVRFPKILGMFLLGLLAGQRSLFGRTGEHAPFFRKVCWWGLGLGLPANGVLAVLIGHHVYLPASPLGLLQTGMEAVGVPALCLFYVAGLTLLFQRAAWRKWLLRLAPVGRMALTNYLIQSIVCVFIFYGFGFGFFHRVSITSALGIAVVIFAVQIPLSLWWLRCFKYGPVEWIWRQLTYRTRISLQPGVPVFSEMERS